MTDPRQAMQMALVALRMEAGGHYHRKAIRILDNALRAAISAQQEPVAWMDDEESGTCNVCGGLLRYGERHRKCGEAVMRAVAEEREQCARLCDEAAKSNEETTARLRWPLEHLAAQIRARWMFRSTPTQPPTVQPLTDEQINQLVVRHIDHGRGCILRVARAIERAHGIGGTHG